MTRGAWALAAFALALPVSPAVAQDETGGYEIPRYIASPALAYHHHPLLRFVFYDEDSVADPLPTIVGMRTPPANVGIETDGEMFQFREIHTHEATSGTLHVESTDPTIKYRLGHFLAVWIAEDPRIQQLVDRAEAEGTVYMFDFDPPTQTFLTTRLTEDQDFRELPLDARRHIVIYLPGEQTLQAPMQPSG